MNMKIVYFLSAESGLSPAKERPGARKEDSPPPVPAAERPSRSRTRAEPAEFACGLPPRKRRAQPPVEVQEAEAEEAVDEEEARDIHEDVTPVSSR